MKVLSLFSGIGGFDLAFKRHDHTIVGACEIDKYAREIYSKHFPGVPIHDDATRINPTELPDFDILCAGFPCQAFSIAGQRRGFDDTRGSLFFEIARIAKEKKPSYLLLENVKGLLSHDKGETFRTILRTLDEMGYDAEWHVLNSKYFVPQNRERIFIIGYLRGTGRRKVFPLGNLSKEITEPKPTNNSQCIAVTKDHDKLRATDNESLAIDANYFKGPDNHGQRTLVYIANTNANMKQRIQNRDESWTLTSNNSDFGVLEPNILGWSKSNREWGVEERIKVGEANTLNTGNGCRNQSTANYVLNKARIRRLTPIECERLQGFPDNWTEGISDTQRYKCLGNAVTVPVIEYILQHLT